jgi:O-antigen/teichoic acid export membrane protein
MEDGLLKDTLKHVPGQGVPAVVGFLSVPIVTRMFHPENYGDYSIAMATVAVLVSFVGWLPVSIVRFYPAYVRDGKLDVLYGNAGALTALSILLIGVAFFVLVSTVRGLLSFHLYVLMCLGVALFVARAVFNVLQHFLMSNRSVGWYAIFASWQSAAGLAAGIALIVLLDIGIEGLVLGAMLSVAVILPLLWKKAAGHRLITHRGLDLKLVKGFASYGFPLVAANLAAWILSLSDRYILQFFRGSEEVGIYSASYSVSEKSVMLIATLFMLASGPISARVWEMEGSQASAAFVNKVTRYFLLVCVPAVVGLSVLSKPIIDLATGDQYLEGHRILPFVTLGAFFMGLQQRFHMGFLFKKKTGSITLAIFLSGLLNLVLNLLLIPAHGYFAAAVTTLISYAFLLVLMIVLSRRFLIWPFPFHSLAKVCCASAVMGMVAYCIGSGLTSSNLANTLLAVVIGVVLYVCVLLALKEFSLEELALLLPRRLQMHIL